jgi:hypothetical protein
MPWREIIIQPRDWGDRPRQVKQGHSRGLAHPVLKYPAISTRGQGSISVARPDVAIGPEEEYWPLMSAEQQAHEAIGRFSCVFSELDYELGQTVKVIFRITDHEAANAIVALADFAKKVNLIKSAVHFARRPDGAELPGQWKEDAGRR